MDRALEGEAADRGRPEQRRRRGGGQAPWQGAVGEEVHRPQRLSALREGGSLGAGVPRS